MPSLPLQPFSSLLVRKSTRPQRRVPRESTSPPLLVCTFFQKDGVHAELGVDGVEQVLDAADVFHHALRSFFHGILAILHDAEFRLEIGVDRYGRADSGEVRGKQFEQVLHESTYKSVASVFTKTVPNA